MIHSLSDKEISKVRRIIEWYERFRKEDDNQLELEKELKDFPTEGDGY